MKKKPQGSNQTNPETDFKRQLPSSLQKVSVIEGRAGRRLVGRAVLSKRLRDTTSKYNA